MSDRVAQTPEERSQKAHKEFKYGPSPIKSTEGDPAKAPTEPAVRLDLKKAELVALRAKREELVAIKEGKDAAALRKNLFDVDFQVFLSEGKMKAVWKESKALS